MLLANIIIEFFSSLVKVPAGFLYIISFILFAVLSYFKPQAEAVVVVLALIVFKKYRSAIVLVLIGVFFSCQYVFISGLEFGFDKWNFSTYENNEVGLNVRANMFNADDIEMSFSHNHDFDDGSIRVRKGFAEVGHFNSESYRVQMVYIPPSDIFIAERFLAKGFEYPDSGGLVRSNGITIHICPDDSVRLRGSIKQFSFIDSIVAFPGDSTVHTTYSYNHTDSIFINDKKASEDAYYFEYINHRNVGFYKPGRPEEESLRGMSETAASYLAWFLLLFPLIVWRVVRDKNSALAFGIFAVWMTVVDIVMIIFTI